MAFVLMSRGIREQGRIGEGLPNGLSTWGFGRDCQLQESVTKEGKGEVVKSKASAEQKSQSTFSCQHFKYFEGKASLF